MEYQGQWEKEKENSFTENKVAIAKENNWNIVPVILKDVIIWCLVFFGIYFFYVS